MEYKIALEIAREIDSPRSLAIAILLSVATGRSSLSFGIRPTREEQEEVKAELLSLKFAPHALPCVTPVGVYGIRRPLADTYHASSSVEKKSRLLAAQLKFLREMQRNIYRTKEDYQIVSFLRKWKGWSIDSVNPTQAARRSFWQSERECLRTNIRFAKVLYEAQEQGLDPYLPEALMRVLLRVRKEFRKVLGRLPHLEELRKEIRFGPGSVLEKKDVYRSEHTTVLDKLDNTLYVTPGALPLFWELCKDTPWLNTWWRRAEAFGLPCYKLVDHERYFTVTKEATTDRSCALGPSANIVCQLAVGRVIRQRLQRFGLLVNPVKDHQVECIMSNARPEVSVILKTRTRISSETKHQLWAQQGSIDGDKATVDFSRASDTVARLLVRFCATDEWFDLLDSLRCHKIQVDFDTDGVDLPDGETRQVLLEKFSSMGNGFTFELETAIFYAIARAVCDDDEEVSVYGDDVILPSHRASDFLSVAKFCGFTPNIQKTYSTGIFRESCGGDFLLGQNIRPYFQKEIIDENRSVVCLLNGLFAASNGACVYLGGYLNRPWRTALEKLPIEIRCMRGPSVLGDAVIHVPDSELYLYALTPKKRKVRIGRHGEDKIRFTKPIEHMECFSRWTELDSNRFFRGMLYTPLLIPLNRWDPDIQLLGALYGVDSVGIAPRGVEYSAQISYFEVG